MMLTELNKREFIWIDEDESVEIKIVNCDNKKEALNILNSFIQKLKSTKIQIQ